ncbi:MAG TPA: glycosyltransferase [Archangium sp.]
MLRSKRPAGPSAARAVHQFLPRLAWGDAVGNQARYLRELLRNWGYASEIYAEQWDEECREQVRPARDYPREADADSALLIHHSFESRLVPLLARSPGRKALVYHNVTPARLFEGFERKVAEACTAAREELLALRPLVECAYAYSGFSAEELVAAGLPHVAVLPFAMDWHAFDAPPDPVLRAELEDGCANVLFVGRAVPHKRVDDVLRAFTAYQRLYQPRSRLVVAGYLNRETPYGGYLHGLRDALGPERVLFLGRVSAAQLSACFATATAYLSMSRHEGFGVPLLEAMHRGVPVVAYGAAAVPETMGGAGLTTFSRDAVEVAGLLAVVERHAELRGQVLDAQRARLAALGQDAVATRWKQTLRPFLEGTLEAPPASASPVPVDLICPALGPRPDSDMARLASRVAEKLGRARVLTLRPGVPSPRAEPEVERHGGIETWRFTPDEPLSREPSAPLPGASSLETAVVGSAAVPVLLGVETASARELLARVPSRVWGVGDPTLPDASRAEARRRLGTRLLELAPSSPDTTATRLAELLSRTGEAHAR